MNVSAARALTIGRCLSQGLSRKMASTAMETKFLSMGKNRTVAYRLLDGKSPGVMFCPGFQSHMQGTKAVALEKFCRERGQSYVRFDYEGMAESGGDLSQATLSRWKEDILAVLDQVTSGPQVLVGSSMGGWLSLLVAMERPDRVAAIVGIATAADFADRMYKRLEPKLQEELQSKGFTTRPSEYGDQIVYKTFIDDSYKHHILTRESLPIDCPIRLIHGLQDVPYTISLDVAQKVTSQDVDVIFRKDGQHRMSRPEDLQLILNTLQKLLDKSS